jgi:hypothetical protein
LLFEKSFIKSLPASLCQREVKYFPLCNLVRRRKWGKRGMAMGPPLWKRGVRGDFLKNINFI